MKWAGYDITRCTWEPKKHFNGYDYELSKARNYGIHVTEFKKNQIPSYFKPEYIIIKGLMYNAGRNRNEMHYKVK